MDCCSETSVSVVKDPVCGMKVDPAKAAGQSQYEGQTYSFCSSGCQKKFDINPMQYMPAGTSKMAASGKYTCPMHPEVQADKAGSCPIDLCINNVTA